MTADLGREILEKYGNEAEDPVKKTAFSEQDKGSIMSILATDLPVTDRQLTRIIAVWEWGLPVQAPTQATEAGK